MQRFETEWGGRPLVIETGKYAQQANGSCLVRYGDTMVMATATMSKDVREGMPFFPLMVDFEEKLYAAGRIKGSRFMKNEGRPTDEAVLTARYIDRAIRPLFDERIRNDIQVIITALSFDGENDPDIIALIAASCALHMSDIPWNGPIADVRVGQVNGEWLINPTYAEREESILDLSFAGTPEKIVMVEAGAVEAPDETVVEGFWRGQEHLAAPIKLIEEVREATGSKEKANPLEAKTDAEREAEAMRGKVEAIAKPFITAQAKELFFGTPLATKGDRREQKDEIKERLAQHLDAQGVEPEHRKYGFAVIGDAIEEYVSHEIIENERRVDGRGLNDIRKLVSEVEVVPRVHGSAHFSRGETQVLSITTLGSPGDEQMLDGMEIVGTKRYFHHYNFPPYSVGETKPLRGPSRRDIGHGALAEKALYPVLPDKEQFPYTIRVVSEVLGSNGSSSMGSTCGSTLALMDAGVPIKAPVAGIAMGLASDERGKWKVFTDLQDLEDSKGGMDFKIAGTRKGITAIQMDTKTDGLTREIVEETFRKAKDARMALLDNMEACLAAPRPELSEHAPRIITMRIPEDRIGDVIGPGGKMINEIIETTGVRAIDIEEDGLVMITSTDAKGAEDAREWISNLTREVEPGETYAGKVTRLMDFGAFVEILPKKEGLVHISKLAPWRVEKVGDIVKTGDTVQVKVTEIDDMGRINLSMKDAEGNEYPKPPADAGNRDRGGNRKPR